MTSEPIEITDEDIEQFVEHGTSEATADFHTILEVWREVLKPARTEQHEVITAAYANRITGSYREIDFADMPEYNARYFAKIIELAKVVDEVIESDDQCLTYTTPEEDVEHNGKHYREVLTNWQVLFVQWEKDWDCTAPDAAVEIASLSEVHRMFFGQQGITAFLEQIQFQFTEDDQAELLATLQDVKDGNE